MGARPSHASGPFPDSDRLMARKSGGRSSCPGQAGPGIEAAQRTVPRTSMMSSGCSGSVVSIFTVSRNRIGSFAARATVSR